MSKYEKYFADYGYKLSIRDNFIYSIEGNNLKICGNSENVFWTAQDVICKNVYDFNSNEDFIMIDIGLNVGMAALSMSRKKNIIKVYGYEPFSPTFEQAVKNLKANPHLSDKLQIFNFGLGSEDEILDLNYNSEFSGSMSSIKNRFPDSMQVERIEIKKASSIISQIIDNHKEKIFLKIDCEGAEENILEDLDNENLLEKINIICMEWHFKEPENLIGILKNNDFVVFSEETMKDELGFIRAVNIK